MIDYCEIFLFVLWGRKVIVTIPQEVAYNSAEGLAATRRLHGKKIVESKPSHFRGLASDGVSGVPE